MASDATGLRDVTLYEHEDGIALAFPQPDEGSSWHAVPAVVGITVAEVERLQAAARERYWDELLAGTTAATKLNEARAKAARYQEALAEGKLTAYMVAPKGFSEEKREAWDFAVYEAEQFIARALRQALGGGDGR